MKHEHALLSFGGEAEQGVRNGGMDFFVVGAGVVALAGGTASRRKRIAEAEDVVEHVVVLI
jgi:hypothetical protein